MPSFERKLNTYEAVKTLLWIIVLIVAIIGGMAYFGHQNVLPFIENFINNMQNRSRNV